MAPRHLCWLVGLAVAGLGAVGCGSEPATVSDPTAGSTEGAPAPDLQPTTTTNTTTTTTSVTADTTTMGAGTPADTVEPAVVPAVPAATSTVAPVDGPAHVMPLGPGVRFSYGREHHDYQATDVFADCGSAVVAPTAGTLLEVRTVDAWVATTDNPATRGGKSIALLGTDGARYYLAHLSEIDRTLAPGQEVVAGQELGQVGRTGRAGACHLHVALSPLCGGTEWKVRRGVIWPWRYLDAWQAGDDLSPIDEIQRWSAEHPDACAEALAEPTAPDA